MSYLGRPDTFNPNKPQLGSWRMMNQTNYTIDPFTGQPVDMGSPDDSGGSNNGGMVQGGNGQPGVNGKLNPDGGTPTKNENGEELADANAISGLQQLASAACGSGCGHCLAMNPSLLQQGTATKSAVVAEARKSADAQSNEVKRHELTHISEAGGEVETSAPSYETQTMNVGGETITQIVAGQVQVSPPDPNGDPTTVKRKALAMKRGALGPSGIAGGLSGADRSAAATAQGIADQQDGRLAKMDQAKTLAATDPSQAKRLLTSAQIPPALQTTILTQANQQRPKEGPGVATPEFNLAV